MIQVIIHMQLLRGGPIEKSSPSQIAPVDMRIIHRHGNHFFTAISFGVHSRYAGRTIRPP